MERIFLKIEGYAYPKSNSEKLKKITGSDNSVGRALYSIQEATGSKLGPQKSTMGICVFKVCRRYNDMEVAV